MTAKDVYRGMKVCVNGLNAVVEAKMLTGCFVVYENETEERKSQRVTYNQLQPRELETKLS